MNTPDRLPPHSPEAEDGILSCIMQAHECLDEAVERLGKADVFYDLRRQVVFNVMVQMREDREPIDVITLQQRLKNQNRLEEVGGIAYLSALPDVAPSPANLGQYLDIAWEKYQLRKVIHACTTAVSDAYDHTGPVEVLLEAVERGIGAIQPDGAETCDGRKCSDRMVDDLERRYKLGGARSGIETGFWYFDNLLDGLQYGEQTIIGARPSMGKTALGIGILMHACFDNRVPTMFVSLEMSVSALMRRMCSARCEVDMGTLRRGSYDEVTFQKFSVFRSFSAKAPMWITDAVRGMGIAELCAVVRRRVRKHGIKLVIIDYLQKIRPGKREEKKTYEIGAVSSDLKALAESTGVAMVTLAQLNRESEKDKGRQPRVSDLGDSKQIEQDADTVALIHRKRDDPNGKADLIVAKQRDGELGIVHLIFNGKFCRFENESPVRDVPETNQPHND